MSTNGESNKTMRLNIHAFTDKQKKKNAKKENKV